MWLGKQRKRVHFHKIRNNLLAYTHAFTYTKSPYSISEDVPTWFSCLSFCLIYDKNLSVNHLHVFPVVTLVTLCGHHFASEVSLRSMMHQTKLKYNGTRAVFIFPGIKLSTHHTFDNDENMCKLYIFWWSVLLIFLGDWQKISMHKVGSICWNGSDTFGRYSTSTSQQLYS